MKYAERFEDLEIWKESIEIAKVIVERLKDQRMIPWPVYNQIIKSAFSISNNIAEGFEHSSPNQFARDLRIAKGSSGELRSQICFLGELGYLPEEIMQKMTKRLSDLSRRISALIHYLKTK